MKVLQLLLAPAIGGAETLAAGLETGLVPHGFDVRTAYLDPTGSSPSPAVRLRRLRSLVREMGPDVVLAHSALPNIYARMVAGRALPVVTVLHSASRDFDSRLLRTAESLLQRRTAAVIAVARPQAEEYEAAFGNQVTLLVVPNGVSPDLPTKRPARNDGAVRVVTLARINQQKDPATWRAAAALAVASQPELQFTWWGPAATDPELQALVVAEGNPALVWAGPTTDVGSVLSAADVYFHPARAEAHPLAPLEAAAVGLPIVCSEAVADALPKGLPSATFATGDPAAAAAALQHVIHDLGAAATNAHTWRSVIRKEYGMDRVVADYSRVLEGVLPRSQVRSGVVAGAI